MPTINQIPERYKGGLTQVIGIDEATFQGLLEALSKAQPSFDSKAVASEVASRVSTISPKDAEMLVGAILSLYSVRHYYDLASDQLVGELAQAMAASEDVALRLNGNEGKFRERMLKLLSIDSLGIASKAFELLYEYERAFCNTRILTDIRPIFGEQPESRPVAALVMHLLRISYHERAELKEFYVALDEGDIKLLREALDRADNKARSLRAVMEDAKVPLM